MADKKINRTKSFMFILPMLGKTILEFKNVLNCFVYADDERGQMYDNNIFILSKFDPSKDFSLFEKRIESHPYYETSYDITNNSTDYVIFVFRVPEQYEYEYKLFTRAKPILYRKFSGEYKEHIINFFNPTMDTSKIRAILYSDEKLYVEMEKKFKVEIPRELDNYAVPDLKEETFNIDKHT